MLFIAMVASSPCSLSFSAFLACIGEPTLSTPRVVSPLSQDKIALSNGYYNIDDFLKF